MWYIYNFRRAAPTNKQSVSQVYARFIIILAGASQLTSFYRWSILRKIMKKQDESSSPLSSKYVYAYSIESTYLCMRRRAKTALRTLPQRAHLHHSNHLIAQSLRRGWLATSRISAWSTRLPRRLRLRRRRRRRRRLVVASTSSGTILRLLVPLPAPPRTRPPPSGLSKSGNEASARGPIASNSHSSWSPRNKPSDGGWRFSSFQYSFPKKKKKKKKYQSRPADDARSTVTAGGAAASTLEETSWRPNAVVMVHARDDEADNSSVPAAVADVVVLFVLAAAYPCKPSAAAAAAGFRLLSALDALSSHRSTLRSSSLRPPPTTSPVRVSPLF